MRRRGFVGRKPLSLRPESAVLEAEVDPEENATTYFFEYGATEAYGTRLPLLGESAGSGVSCVKVSDAVVGLVEGQSYYFRVVAENGGKTAAVAGSADEFRTPVDWQMGGREVEAGEPLRSAGTLLLEAPVYGTVRAECSVDEVGEAEADGAGTVTSVTGAKGEKAISCGLVKKGECFSSTGEVEAVGLPWRTELVDVPVKNAAGDVERYEVRDRFYSGSGGSIGWMVKCKTGEVTHSDVCTGEFSGNLENVSAGVPVELDAASPRLTCEYKDPGAVTGVLVFSSGVEGELLSVSGALAGPQRPVVVTGEADASAGEARLTGTVAARGAATSYWFEYGQTTGYGMRVPVSSGSAGEGRLPVEVSQLVSGLSVDTLYHYRLVASDGGGVSYGEDKTVTPGDPAGWRVNGKTESSAVTAAGTLVVEASIDGSVTAECAVSESGKVPWFGLYKYGEIATVTAPKGETVVPCTVIKKSLWCLGSSAKLEAEGLPWKTELEDVPIKNAAGEVVRYELRDRVVSLDAGWTLKCTQGETVHTATCLGEMSGNMENVPAGEVAVEFDAKAARLNCGEEKENGSQAGYLVLSGEKDSLLSVAGAPEGPLPPVVVTGEADASAGEARLTGTVAARGAATSYWFEYGQTTGYGVRVPVSSGSAGEGRLPVEVSQLVSGLSVDTLYHYRLVASDGGGVSYGEDKTVTPGDPAGWRVNGKTESSAVTAAGTLVVEASIDGSVTAECAVSESGKVPWFGLYKYGEIATVTAPKGETVVPCTVIKKSLWCLGSSAKLEAEGLPWKTELEDVPIKNAAGEVVRYELRDRVVSLGAGWTLKCTQGETVHTATCLGEMSGNMENVPAGEVAVEFDAKAARLNCGEEKENGSQAGYLVLSGEKDSLLSVAGAPEGPLPPVVVTREATETTASEARLTGTVAARGAATSYWFEYGQTTGYGVRVPVSSGSAGEARLPVEVSQSVSGLEVGVLYHYRLVASNSGGISYGEDKTVTPGDPSRWHLGSEQKPSALDGAGTLLIEAPAYGKVRAECAVAMTGETPILGALYQYGTITAVTGAKGEKAIPCSLAKKGGCLSSTGELEAVGLPWRTELMDVPVKNAAGEVARYEVRDRFYSSDGENDAGWTLACKNGETTHATTCAGEFSGNLENTPAGVPVELDDSSPPLSCSSGEEPAVLAGAIVFSSGQEGEQLNVTGAPTGPQKPAVATGEAQETTSTTSKLTGTIATRAAATSYHFQYGPTIKYGSSIPGEGKEASAGESRTPLEVSQTISALQPRTLYHYRLVATNSAGTTYGTDKTLITEHPAQWQINAKTIIDAPIQGEGTLTIHDSGLDLTAECALQNTGYVKDSSGEIETLTGSKGETSIDCHPTSSGWCATTQIEITGTQLPWNTELIDQPTENSEGETHYEPRLRLQNTSWTIKCAYMGSTITDTCTGQPTAHTENTPTATLIDFETNTPTLTCTGSTISTGTIQGTLTLKSTETGKTLNIYGAPGP